MENITEDKLLKDSYISTIKKCKLLEAIAYNNKKYDIAKNALIWLSKRFPSEIDFRLTSEIAYYIDKIGTYDIYDKKILVDYYNINFKKQEKQSIFFLKRHNQLIKVLKKFKMIDNLPDRLDVDKFSGKSDNKK